MKKWLLLLVFMVQGVQAELCYKYSAGRIKYMRNHFAQYSAKLRGIRNYDGTFFVERQIPLSFRPPQYYLKPMTQTIKLRTKSDK